jgi:hypothetical protein
MPPTRLYTLLYRSSLASYDVASEVCQAQALTSVWLKAPICAPCASRAALSGTPSNARGSEMTHAGHIVVSAAASGLTDYARNIMRFHFKSRNEGVLVRWRG